MKQRVKLAQALVHDPGMLLLDEPTNGLDPAGRDQMLTLLRRIGTDFGIPMLVTSHLLGELEQICDHVVVIDGGRLLRSSSTADVTSASRIIAVEVDERTDDLAQALRATGLTVHRDGRQLDVEMVDDGTYDAVRDSVVSLGVGLLRMERRRHRMVEIFQADPTLDVAERGPDVSAE
jgi:ABC-2 type transport system ATP-binding protein